MKPIEILLIEDNEGDIFLTSETLKESPIPTQITIVRDGYEAVKYLQKKEPYCNCTTPDLIFLDINLPKLNGHEVLKRMKSTAALKDLPVVMLSTSSSKEDQNLSYENKADRYLTKPLDVEIFTEIASSVQGFPVPVIHFFKNN